jgi:hypothetical protein
MLEGFHLKVSQIVLEAIKPFGFALGGGYALQAHGIIDRESKDIDSYTATTDVELFDRAEAAVTKALKKEGYSVIPGHIDSWFRELIVTDKATNDAVGIDLGYDYRKNEPVIIAGIGPVLDIEDVITGKVRAFWDRQAARDYLDIDAILASRRWSAVDLFAKLKEPRPEATLEAFAAKLGEANIDAAVYAEYGLSLAEVEGLCTRLSEAAASLQ